MKRERAKAIPPDREPDILAKAGEGLSTRKIAAWLLAEHGLECSHVAVARFLQQTRATRADTAKVVLREKLSKSLLGDVDRLTQEQERVEKLAARLHDRAHAVLNRLDAIDLGSEEASSDTIETLISAAEKISDLALKSSDRVKALADRKLHYSGADAPDDALTELVAAEGRLASKLARLRPEAPGDVPGEPDAAGESGS